MIRLRKLKTRHGETHVLEGGAGSDLMFLHGAGGVIEQDPLLNALAENYHVCAPLLPGYGASDECLEIRDMLDITLHTYDVLEALGLNKPILAGHSMGGMIAAEMAAVNPNEVQKLCLICPAGLWLEEHPIPDIFAMMPYELPGVLFHDVEAGTKMMTAGLDFSNLEFLKSFLVQNARQLGMAGKILFPIPDRGLRQRLYRIKARTLLIWGDSDKLIVPRYAQEFKNLIANCELVSIAEAGHMLPIEKTTQVVAAIRRLDA